MKGNILRQIDDERANQDAKWGGPSHDDEHGPGDWRAFIEEHVAKACPPNPKLCGCREAMCAHLNLPPELSPTELVTFRRQMIRVAALAVAAIESVDRQWKDSRRG